VANAVQANLLAATNARPEARNQVHNIAVGERTTLNDLFTLICDNLTNHSVHAGTQPVYRDFRAGDVRHSLADISKGKNLLGYAPTIHHDRPAGHTLLKIGRWARNNGIPVALVNAGWEANSAEMAKLLSDFSLVAVRDAASAAELHSQGQPCRIVPDLSVYESVQLATATGGNGPILFADSVNRFTALALELARQATHGETLSIVYPASGFSG
jgi:hypothetical protein